MEKNTAAPCPFCGGTNIETTTHDRTRLISMMCGDCTAEGPAIEGEHAERHALTAWNSRASHPAPQAAAEGVGSIGDDAKFVALLDWLLEAFKSGKKADLPRFNEGVQEFIAYIDSRAAPERAAIPPQEQTASCPEGWKLVPIEPTEDMIVDGFESAPCEGFTPIDEFEAYDAMSGCQQAAHRARLCYDAMLAAAPTAPAQKV